MFSARQLDSDLSGVVELVRSSLVEIRNGHGAGAGTIWHADGLIITNAHVLGKQELQVTLADRRVFPGRILAADAKLDLAAVLVEARGLRATQLGNSSKLKPGEWVSAIGHPWGVSSAVTSGVVIGTGAEFPEMPTSGKEWIVANLHMRPGHSGGALVDSSGKLVGVNTMITGPDVGVAIPVHKVQEFLDQAGIVFAERLMPMPVYA